MCEDFPDVHLFSIKMDDSDETIPVATDIEYYIAVNIIRTREMLSQLAERIVVGSLDDSIPSIK